MLLQVQQHGEAWYINPADQKRYYLGKPTDAFQVMRELGIGISNNDFDSFWIKVPARLSGRILLKVQDLGKAYYINPKDLKMHYLGSPSDAFQIMRKVGLGVTKIDLEKIPQHIKGTITPQQTQVSQTKTGYQSNETDIFYPVARIVDGDTFDVVIDEKTERIRTIGMDTPEVVDPRKTVQYFGKEASAKATELLLNRRVRLEADPTQGERDSYGRLLRYVYRDDGLFFNKWMIENGFAHEYTFIIPYKFQEEFQEAQKAARENARGLWAPKETRNNTESTKQAEQSQETQSAQSEGHTWYTSSHPSAKYYYCDTDLVWQELKKENVRSFSSEAELLKKFERMLHEPCK